MVVKDNQPQLPADVQAIFDDPPPGDEPARAASRDSRHGRIERRRLTVSAALADSSDWPGLRQVFRLERRTHLAATGEVRGETVYGVTSLPPRRATAARLLQLT